MQSLIKQYSKVQYRLMYWQGRNQLGGRGGRAPSKMWLFIVIVRRKREKRVFFNTTIILQNLVEL